MRRRLLTATALGGLLAVALTGCGRPAGVDGNLTNNWGAFDEPTIFVPHSGVCHESVQNPVQVTGYLPVDCAETHLVETVHVGTLTGEHADGLTPPPTGSPAARAGYAECDRKASEFVGAPWRGALLNLTVSFPTDAAWAAGARWFRCDLAEVASLFLPLTVKRTGSLAKELSKDSSPLALRCFNPELANERVKDLLPIACDKPHRAEFVGVRTAPDVSYGSLKDRADELHRGCRSVIAKYAGLPDDRNMPFRSGTIYIPPSEEEWIAGDRTVRCFLYLDSRTISRSVKNGGNAALPVQ